MCLERLCIELEALGVTLIVLESRGPADKFDRKLVDTLRSKKALSTAVRVEHVAGPVEPLLWIADIVCGAVSQASSGKSTFLTTPSDQSAPLRPAAKRPHDLR